MYSNGGAMKLWGNGAAWYPHPPRPAWKNLFPELKTILDGKNDTYEKYGYIMIYNIHKKRLFQNKNRKIKGL